MIVSKKIRILTEPKRAEYKNNYCEPYFIKFSHSVKMKFSAQNLIWRRNHDQCGNARDPLFLRNEFVPYGVWGINAQHEVIFEIGYHFEPNMSKHGESVLHVHDYSAPGIQNRGKARLITEEELKKYRKFFKGVDL